ncbi:LuxR C-terminal-related transcriptional regulator [Streptomyces sp. NPDC087850]|uniref:helix-turn-helix transcriptional regulator n=1 Tax=Streptomyces sp. NPDC087850 TaxID=3365809 RepID=UPI003802948D
MVIEGGAGCGKSNLLEDFVQHARLRDAVVVDARDLGFDYVPRVSTMNSTATVEFQEFCTRLETLAGQAQVVITLDDLQDLDSLSWRWLLEATRSRLRASKLMLVLVQRSLGGSLGPDFHFELLRQPNLRRVRLLPLSRQQVAGMITALNQTAETDPYPEDVYRLSGGNPLLIRALLEEWRTRGGGCAQAPWPAPGGLYAQAVRGCVHGNDPSVVAIATGIAILGESSGPDLLARLLDRTTTETAQGIRALSAAGLVNEWHFRHSVVNCAILETIGPRHRAELRHRAAKLLSRTGADSRTVARHLLDAGSADQPWQITALRHAADEALESDDAEQADACLSLAHDASADPWERARLRLKRALVMWRTDLFAVEGQYLNGYRDQQDLGEERDPADTYLLAQLLIGHGRMEEGWELLRESRAATADLRDVDNADLLSTAWPWFFYPGRGAPGAWLAGIRSLGQESPVPPAGNSAGGHDASHSEKLLRATPLTDMTLSLVLSELDTLVRGGRQDLAGVWCERFLNDAVARGIRGWQQLFAALRATISLRQGMLNEAERFALMSLDTSAEWSSTYLYGGPVSVLIHVYTEMGRYKDAARLLDRTPPEALFKSVHGLVYLRARGHYSLAINRPHLALSDFLGIGRHIEYWGLEESTELPWRVDAAEAWLRLDNPAQARLLLTAHDAVADHGDPKAAGTTLYARALLAEPAERLRLLRGAVERLREAGNRLQLAKTLVELAAVHRSLGQSSRADLALRNAGQIAGDCGAQSLLERITPLQQSRKLPPESRWQESNEADPGAKLSDSERRVAVLAGRGLTNREISAELYITMSTVEQHLTRVYRKLDIASRQEIPIDIQIELPQTV